MKRQDELNEAWCKYMGKCSTEILHALAFALRWCDEHPNWISVEDELPKKLETVLCTNGHDVGCGFYDSDDSGDHMMWAAPHMGCFEVTHWMQKPQAPLVTDLNKKNLPPVSWQEGNILVKEEGGKQ